MAGDLHLPRSTMDVTVPGMAATMTRSALGQPQGLLRMPSASGGTTAGAGIGGSGQSRQPGTPRRDDMLDDTFIDVSSWRILSCIVEAHAVAESCMNFAKLEMTSAEHLHCMAP